MKFEAICSTAVRHFDRFCADENGATAIEYALVASGVGAAIAATIYQLGSGVAGFYQTLAGLLPG